MVKVALLSIEQNILKYVEEFKERFCFDFIILKVISLEEVEYAVHEVEKAGVDLIIAYGLQSLVNGTATKLPVVNIMLSGQDIGMLLKEAKASLNEQIPDIALMVYSCMYRRSSNMGEMLGVGLHVYLLDEYENHEAAVSRAIKNGAHMIIGIRDVFNLAEEQGIPTLSLFSGKEGVLQALRNAELLSNAIEIDKKRTAENAAYMNSIFHGIIEVNKNGEILRLNDYAKNLLDCKNRDIIGQPLLSCFPRTIKDNLETVLRTGQQLYTLNIKLKHKNMITNIEPIILDDEIIGAVITMQKGEFAHEYTLGTPNEEHLRGFKATNRFENIKVKSECYGNLIKEAKQAAYSDAPVLIYGEQGTETLMLAQCIHNESSRRKGGFIEVACSAWEPEHLNEMLFGSKSYQSGGNDSYTLVEMAENGTLFLNNIDTLTNELQFRICRLIRGVITLNNTCMISSNIRVIAATESNPSLLKSQGKLRNDLYYALNVLTLEIPPLRERKEDLESLIDSFLNHYCSLYSKPIQLSKGACRFMCEYTWPDNFRQLENLCHKIVSLTRRRSIDEAFVRDIIGQMDQRTDSDGDRKAEKSLDKNALKVLEALNRNSGSRAKTARELGISATTLWRLMQKYGITSDYSV